MEVQIVISTINNCYANIEKNLEKNENVIVINQKPDKLDGKIEVKEIKGLTWIDYDEIGLSKSRNLGIELVRKDLIYLTDDDVVISKEFESNIVKVFLENNTYDIIAFQVEGIERDFKKFSKKTMNINKIRSLKLSSVQLVMKTAFINENNIRFDELFGAGSLYKMGEENIFLFDALSKGAKIKYIPSKIAKLHMGESSWFTGFNEKYFFDRGAIFYRMYNNFLRLFHILSFCIRKYNLYKSEMSFYGALKNSLNGYSNYKKIKLNSLSKSSSNNSPKN